MKSSVKNSYDASLGINTHSSPHPNNAATIRNEARLFCSRAIQSCISPSRFSRESWSLITHPRRAAAAFPARSVSKRFTKHKQVSAAACAARLAGDVPLGFTCLGFRGSGPVYVCWNVLKGPPDSFLETADANAFAFPTFRESTVTLIKDRSRGELDPEFVPRSDVTGLGSRLVGGCGFKFRPRIDMRPPE